MKVDQGGAVFAIAWGGRGVEDSDWDCAVRPTDSCEFDGGDGVLLVRGDGVDAEDREVVGTFSIKGSFAAEMEGGVVVEELLNFGGECWKGVLEVDR